MTLEDKVKQAKLIIAQTVRAAKNPIVMSSFGKDSMVMLDLFMKLNLELPILSMREPFHPKKYEFANDIVKSRDYTVYDYPPAGTAVVKKDNNIEIANFYQVGPEENIYLPTGIKSPEEGEDFLCGLQDFYLKPKGTFQFPWDVVFIGHKSSDVDPIMGRVKLKSHKASKGRLTFVFPIKDFTDEDVWEYTKEHSVPVNWKRYEGGKELPSIKYNPDYFHACTACIDRDNPGMVFCPKKGKEILNVADEIVYVDDFPRIDYIEKE